MSNNLFPYRPIIKLRNRKSIYYRKDGNKLGKRKLELLDKRGLLPTQFGVLIEVTFTITDLSSCMMTPISTEVIDG